MPEQICSETSANNAALGCESASTKISQSPVAAALSAASAAKQANVKIDTIAYGTPDGAITIQGQTVGVPADPATMSQIASTSGGQTFTAQTASQLSSVYNQIGRAVGYDVHRRPIAAWFTAAALFIALAGGIAALIWTQRVV